MGFAPGDFKGELGIALLLFGHPGGAHRQDGKFRHFPDGFGAAR